MKIIKEKSRVYNGKPYFKYKINLPEEVLKEAGLKEGDEVDAKVERGEVRLKKKLAKK
jgi:bifunctional DNA-binding transcriptional regulator/antitoxin component of YhaV-PrlF toxin-antitoxin module